MDNNKQTTAAAHEEFHNEFLPKVHRIGTATMLIALVFSLLPTFYFIFIKGIDVSTSALFSVVVAIVSFALGQWFSEPAAFWPVLGSAGTYFGFLAGNASNMRLPVALTARASLDESDDMEHPKVHVAIIIALFASVVVNLAILLCIVVIGDRLVAALPPAVLGAFSFVMPCVIANNVLMMSKNKSGVILPGFFKLLPYLIAGAIAQSLIKYKFTFLSPFGILISVAAAVVTAYFVYRHDVAADGAPEKGTK